MPPGGKLGHGRLPLGQRRERGSSKTKPPMWHHKPPKESTLIQYNLLVRLRHVVEVVDPSLGAQGHNHHLGQIGDVQAGRVVPGGLGVIHHGVIKGRTREHSANIGLGNNLYFYQKNIYPMGSSIWPGTGTLRSQDPSRNRENPSTARVTRVLDMVIRDTPYYTLGTHHMPQQSQVVIFSVSK